MANNQRERITAMSVSPEPMTVEQAVAELANLLLVIGEEHPLYLALVKPTCDDIINSMLVRFAKPEGA